MIVYETMNERHMLNQFLCKLQNLDPDGYVVCFDNYFPSSWQKILGNFYNFSTMNLLVLGIFFSILNAQQNYFLLIVFPLQNFRQIQGHDLPAQLSLLSSRLEKLKIAHWSRVGRLKRSITIKQIAHTKTLLWELTAGRLILDSRFGIWSILKIVQA